MASVKDGLCWTQFGLDDEIRWRISDFFTDGVVEGLTVMPGYDGLSGTVLVFPGIARDGNGERIIVPELLLGVKYGNFFLNEAIGNYYITARYREDTDGVTGGDPDGNIYDEHITDSYSVQVLKSGVDNIPDNDVILGEVIINNPYDPITINGNAREEIALSPEVSRYVGLTDDSIFSYQIKEADGTTGQDTNSGSGVKTGHFQDGCINSNALLAERCAGGLSIQQDALTELHIHDDALTYTNIRESVKFHIHQNGSASLSGATTATVCQVIFTPAKKCDILILASAGVYWNVDNNYGDFSILIDGGGVTGTARVYNNSPKVSGIKGLFWLVEGRSTAITVALRAQNYANVMYVNNAHLVVIEIPKNI